MNTITFEVNNNGVMTLAQERHDGSVDLIITRQGEIKPTVTISAGDMVLLMDYYRYQKEHSQPIF